LPGKNTRILLQTFRTDNNVIRPIKPENFIKEQLESIAENNDITVTDAGLYTVVEKAFKFIGRD
jgi:hypothetical protein